MVAVGVQSTALAFAAGALGAWCFASKKRSNRNRDLLFPQPPRTANDISMRERPVILATLKRLKASFEARETPTRWRYSPETPK